MTDGMFNGAVREVATASPPVTSSGSEHLALGLLADRAAADLREARATLARIRDLAESWTEVDGWGAPTREMLAGADCGREILELIGKIAAEAGSRTLPPVPGEEYMTPGEARAVLGARLAGLRHLEKRGRLTSVRTIGGHRRYLTDSVRALRAELDAARVPPEGLLSAVEVAAMFPVHVNTVIRWVRAGMLEPVKVPGCRTGFRPEDVRALMRGDGNGEG